MTAATGVQLGKYRIVRQLGKGAMGVVSEAVDSLLDRTVALKTVRKEFIEDPRFLERFKREARAAARLSHPNIVTVYEYGEEDDTAFIAMEFVRGRELKAWIEAGERFSPAQATQIVGQVLDALGYAHDQGVVHRDIKPANLMLLDGGTRLKVADFGIARLEHSDLTQTGHVLGTPSYMSPEQFMGQTVDGRADLFATGVMLYELLTGERPFAGQSATTIMYRVLTEEPTPPSELSVQINPALNAVLIKALAKKPLERFQTAAEFKAALEAATAGELLQPLHAPAPERNAALGPTFSENPAPPRDDQATAMPGGADASWFRTVVPGPAASEDEAPVVSAPRHAAVTDARDSTRPGGGQALLVMGALAAIALVAMGVYVGSLFTAGEPGHVTTSAPAADSSLSSATSAPAAALPGMPATETGTAAGTASTASREPAATAAPLPVLSVPEAAVTPATNPAAVPLAEPLLPSAEPALVTIAAVGMAMPGSDPVAAGSAAAADSRRQLVEKALALYLDPESLRNHYGVLRQHVLAHPDAYIERVLSESAPALEPDGLMHANVTAVLKVKVVQQDLNTLSAKERLELIRLHGDPLIAIEVTAAEEGGGLNGRSPLAENILKEQVQGFGYRTLTEGPEYAKADFRVEADVRLKRLSARLPASGILVEKTALTSWTIRCLNARTGEEIHVATELPGKRSWPTPDAAMAEVGKLIGERFTAEFFEQNSNFTGQPLRLRVAALPAPEYGIALGRELAALRSVLEVVEQPQGAGVSIYDLLLAEPSGDLRQLVESRILGPLHAKLGRSCFSLGGSEGAMVGLQFVESCGAAASLEQLQRLPPAELYVAPAERRSQVLQGYAAPAGMQGPLIDI
jgi:eukaryotic-like serine/threonine-protein kinase